MGKNCKQVAKDGNCIFPGRDKKTGVVSNGFDSCCKSCDTDGPGRPCEDDEKWYHKKKKQDCKWVKKDRKKRCGKKGSGSNSKKAKDACYVACKTCDTADRD